MSASRNDALRLAPPSGPARPDPQAAFRALGATKDVRHITADAVRLEELIAGVVVHEARNIPKPNGLLVEVWRREWRLDGLPLDQIFLNHIHPGGISGWHAHAKTTDRIFVCAGVLQIVLWDGRPDSPTHGLVNELVAGVPRPRLVIVPPGVWHGVRNTSSESAVLLNAVDVPYDYDDPDHWRLPPDTDRIPFPLVPSRP